MSALPPKADMCSALADVRFVPIADIPRGELCAMPDEKQRGRLGHKAASKRDKGGDGGTGLVPLSSPYCEIRLAS